MTKTHEFHLTGAARKPLIEAIESFANVKGVYQGAPKFGYAFYGVGVLDKEGSLHFDCDAQVIMDCVTWLWEYIDIYTDEGITGCNTKKREGFNRMVADGLAGRFDLLVTKSVSRFARNTVDSLTTVRKFKENGVEIFFEKEAIWTFDGKGELLITIMSSLAQEESRSISENVTWGQRKRFADGKVSMPYAQFLGYEKGEDGTPIVVEAEAEIVRLIFRLFIEGKTPSAIAKFLMAHDIPSPAGKPTWQVATVRSILQNEKFKGDALLQKKFTVNFLTKEQKVNEGEVPQFYVEGSHPYIIEPDEFDAVQAEFARRNSIDRPMRCNSPFSAKIVCGTCGGFYGSKVWGSNTKYRRIIWRCNDKYKGDAKCETPHVTEDDVKQKFLIAWNSLAANRENLIADCKAAKKVLCDTTAIDTELAELHREVEVVSELSRKAIFEAAHPTDGGAIDLNERNGGYLERLKTANARISELEEAKRQKQYKARLLGTFLRNLNDSPLVLDEFDEALWMATIDRVTVMPEGKLIFLFRNGTEIEG